MHDQPTRGPDRQTQAETDEQTQGVVLTHLLDLYPAQLTVAEVISGLRGENATFGDRDDLQRAMRDLDYAGLLHRREELVWPSRAAVAARVLRLA